ncbi:MAG: preprotein translocase subunit SecE [Solirubrobacteraceae bacterium]
MRARRQSRPDDGAGRAILGGTDFDPAPPDLDEAPPPLEHATPDAELAEAQLALGRPELADAVSDEESLTEYEEEYDQGADELEELDDAGGGVTSIGGGGSGRGGGTGRGRGGGGAARSGGSGGGELALPAGAAVEHVSMVSRLVAFLQGSWRELHRVQWPDRRQVMQATGVVLGFVIVAGVYLGVADWAAQKIVNLIITK